jgi:phage host-nuclease inhibitor protein Gam
MARKKVPVFVPLSSWEDVDKTMSELAAACRCIKEIEAEMNRQVDKIKDEASRLAKPYQNRVSELEHQICDFVTEHRAELKGKTRKLVFGSTGFRRSTKVHIPSKKMGDVILRCREFGMDDCITVKESVLKDVMRQRYSAEEISRTGASLKVADEFWYELNEETLTD